MAIVTATQKREKEGGRDGRGERRVVHCPKMEGVCAPSNVRTGGTRRSEERGDRRAGEQEGDK
jgi:hypothetical protein